MNYFLFNQSHFKNIFLKRKFSNTSICYNFIKRGEEREKPNFQIGNIIYGYKILEVTPIPERNLTAIKLEHLKTGAKHLHIDCSDTNNVFCVTFKTIPRDNTGIAHILEHTTLCGSKKYPVRDPFFNMLKRSLNTYMNAWTGSDFTSYPFSTQNIIDYQNLLSVYLDAVFFPKLEKIDFMQEGHRLEPEDISDPNSPLIFKGVVFNEMKGSLSDSSTLFSYNLQKCLFPNTTYEFNSGGDPSEIPNLTHEQLIEFHKRHYHPSNARFFTYGDLPLKNHLKYIHENALINFEKINPNTDVENVERFKEPKRFSLTCPPTPMSVDPEKDTKVCISVVANNIIDTFETFSLMILGYLLLSGPNAPLYKALIDSNIGLSYSPSTGYDTSTKECTFGIGLQGIRKDDVIKVEKIINDTLNEVAEIGFDSQRIESILHQIELSQKNVTSNFGMQIIQSITDSWIHYGDPVEQLQINKYINQLREELKKGPFFQNKIKQYLLNNNHKVILEMNPEEDYVKKKQEEEEKKLKKINETLTPKDKEEIIKLAKILKEKQEIKPDVSCLPTLFVKDIPPNGEKIILQEQNIKNIPVFWCNQPTNGIISFRLLIPIPDISDELLPFIPLFCSILAHMGTKKKNYRELAQEIELYTGGISVTTSLVTNHSNIFSSEGHIYISTMALERNIPKMFDILQEIITLPIFNNPDLLRTYIYEKTSNFQESLINNGHVFAMSQSSSPFTRSYMLSELWGGISQASFMQSLAQQEDLSFVIEKLQKIASLLLDKAISRCLVTTEEKYFSQTEKYLNYFMDSLPSNPMKDKNIGEIKEFPNEKKKIYITLPGLQVHHIASSFLTIPYTHPDSPKLKLLSRLVSSCFLHPEIREKGGAYGSGALDNSGIFSFYSYRDPHIYKTLNIFSQTFKWLKENNFTEQDIEEAKLSLFSDIDIPIAPSAKGVSEFTTGITYEMREEQRKKLFSITRKDLLDVGEKYLSQEQNSITVLGPEPSLTFKEKNPNWVYWSDIINSSL